MLYSKKSDTLQFIPHLIVYWQDVLAFAQKEITGDQLAARVLRFNP
jgi:hypothetical protein